MKKFNARVRFGKVSTNDYENWPDGQLLLLEIEDTDSGTRVVKIELSLHEAAQALLTNTDGVKVVGEVTDYPERIGAKWVTRSETLAWSIGTGTVEGLDALITEQEVDGWHRVQEAKAGPDFSHNHHHYSDGGYRVIFGRHEDEDGNPV